MVGVFFNYGTAFDMCKLSYFRNTRFIHEKFLQKRSFGHRNGACNHRWLG